MSLSASPSETETIEKSSARRRHILFRSALVAGAAGALCVTWIALRRSSHIPPGSPPVSTGVSTATTAPPTSATSPPAAGADAKSSRLANTTSTLQARLRQHPEDLRARIELAALLDMRGDASDAEDVLRAALQRGQRSPDVVHALGMLYLHHNQYSGAIEAFRSELLLRPKNAQAHLNLAQAYAYVYQSDDARREFETARKLDPSLADVYMGLAFLNNTSERYQYAVQYLHEYLKRSKQPGPGYALLSRIYLNMRSYDKAVDAGRKAVAAMPGNGNVWYNLGQAYAYRPGTASLGEAAQAFEHAVQLLPNWGHARFELGYAYARQHRNAEAIAQYREAVRCEPDNGKFHYQLGRLLALEHQLDEGKKEIERAQPLLALNQRESQLQDKIAVAPRDPQNFLELGQVYRQLGNTEQATKCFQTVLSLDPHNVAARDQLAQMSAASQGTPPQASR